MLEVGGVACPRFTPRPAHPDPINTFSRFRSGRVACPRRSSRSFLRKRGGKPPFPDLEAYTGIPVFPACNIAGLRGPTAVLPQARKC